ncbi:MAG: hypothetical protein LBH04_02435 [Tannerellaceae bacterium]|jgi:hypothetical protein|nr:hypothetical protein [Tannerellaceae bacterium]
MKAQGGSYGCKKVSCLVCGGGSACKKMLNIMRGDDIFVCFFSANSGSEFYAFKSVLCVAALIYTYLQAWGALQMYVFFV